MGGAFNATVRQIGAALGIAVVVALLGESSGLDAFDDCFTFIALSGLASGLLMWALYRPPILPVAGRPEDGALAAVP